MCVSSRFKRRQLASSWEIATHLLERRSRVLRDEFVFGVWPAWQGLSLIADQVPSTPYVGTYSHLQIASDIQFNCSIIPWKGDYSDSQSTKPPKTPPRDCVSQHIKQPRSIGNQRNNLMHPRVLQVLDKRNEKVRIVPRGRQERELEEKGEVGNWQTKIQLGKGRAERAIGKQKQPGSHKHHVRRIDAPFKVFKREIVCSRPPEFSPSNF